MLDLNILLFIFYDLRKEIPEIRHNRFWCKNLWAPTSSKQSYHCTLNAKSTFLMPKPRWHWHKTLANLTLSLLAGWEYFGEYWYIQNQLQLYGSNLTLNSLRVQQFILYNTIFKYILCILGHFIKSLKIQVKSMTFRVRFLLSNVKKGYIWPEQDARVKLGLFVILRSNSCHSFQVCCMRCHTSSPFSLLSLSIVFPNETAKVKALQ